MDDKIKCTIKFGELENEKLNDSHNLLIVDNIN